MRKLKLQVQISVDGYIADTDGSTEWLVWKNWDENWNWDENLKKYLSEIINKVDCILLSGKIADGFITHWKTAAEDPNDRRSGYARKINSTNKVIFSKTTQRSNGKNLRVANGNLVTEVNNLKKENGGDIIVYGGAGFVSSLIKDKLIDEFQLFINPTILGSGMPIFNQLDNTQNLRLTKAKSFDCGIAVLTYEPLRQDD